MTATGIITATGINLVQGSGRNAGATGILTAVNINSIGGNFTGVVTASSFSGDGSALTGVGTQGTNVQAESLTVSGISTFNDNVFVGSGITMFSSSGIVSATAFYGDGSNLTGAGFKPDADENLVAGTCSGCNLIVTGKHIIIEC